MFNKQEFIEFCETARSSYLDHISIDCVVFGFHEGQLKVLGLKIKNEESWYLPGGFVVKDEPIEMAANRILKERTGLDEIFCNSSGYLATPTAQDHTMTCIKTCCHRKRIGSRCAF